ncbi:hypothetical protein ACHAXN_000362 [Cyclotella atomus]
MMALDKKKKPLWRCTGTLISSTLFLTAGHCVEEPAASATIWFDTDVENGIPENGYPLKGEVSAKSIRIHPDYNTRAFYLHDLGMVKLTKPVKRDYYGELPVEGLLDELNTGGTCFGDSGGPLCLEDTNVIVGVTSYRINQDCAGTGGSYRIDADDNLEWIHSFF